MATNAVFAILPIVWKWKYGRDTTFLAKTAYPLMRSVADFSTTTSEPHERPIRGVRIGPRGGQLVR